MISPLSGERNLTMLTDLYQLTMANGYLQKGVSEKRAVFDLFYRGSGGYSYAVAAGLEQACSIFATCASRRKTSLICGRWASFPENFLARLKTFRFTGDLKAIPEGTMIFPSEPILTVSAPIFEAQIIETALLTIVNHQTLIATTAARLAACTDAKILEFGLRRAQGPDAGTYGARAAYIGRLPLHVQCACGGDVRHRGGGHALPQLGDDLPPPSSRRFRRMPRYIPTTASFSWTPTTP